MVIPVAKAKAAREYTPAEANKRRDAALRAALNMSASPHTGGLEGKPIKPKVKAKAKRR
jgi:hypothetical protein